MTWIWQQFPSISNITYDIILETPCELNIQMPNILSNLAIAYIVNYSYWFSDPFENNTGMCDIYNDTNIKENALDCTSSDETSETSSECSANHLCPWPFALSNYKQHIFNDMCYCGMPCDIYPYPKDIKILDIFINISNAISLLFLVIYSFNLYSDMKQMKNDHKNLYHMPLTFDIPLICTLGVFIFVLVMNVSKILGKNEFNCETNTRALVVNYDLPHSNRICYIQGSILFISMNVVFYYLVLLSFSIWTYLSSPMRPLLGYKKRYFHAGVWIFITSFV